MKNIQVIRPSIMKSIKYVQYGEAPLKITHFFLLGDQNLARLINDCWI